MCTFIRIYVYSNTYHSGRDMSIFAPSKPMRGDSETGSHTRDESPVSSQPQ